MPLLSLPVEILCQILQYSIAEDITITSGFMYPVLRIPLPPHMRPTSLSLAQTSQYLRAICLPHLYATVHSVPPLELLPQTPTDIFTTAVHLALNLPPRSRDPLWAVHWPALLDVLQRFTGLRRLEIISDNPYEFFSSSHSGSGQGRQRPAYTTLRAGFDAVGLYPILRYYPNNKTTSEIVVREYAVNERYRLRFPPIASWHGVSPATCSHNLQDVADGQYETMLVAQTGAMMASIECLWLKLRLSGATPWIPLLREAVGRALVLLEIHLAHEDAPTGMCAAVAALSGQLGELVIEGGCVCAEMFPVEGEAWNKLGMLTVICKHLCQSADKGLFMSRAETMSEMENMFSAGWRIGLMRKINREAWIDAGHQN